MNCGPKEVNALTSKCSVLFRNRNAAKFLFDTDFVSPQSVLWVILYTEACCFWELYAHIKGELPLLFSENPV